MAAPRATGNVEAIDQEVGAVLRETEASTLALGENLGDIVRLAERGARSAERRLLRGEPVV